MTKFRHVLLAATVLSTMTGAAWAGTIEFTPVPAPVEDSAKREINVSPSVKISPPCEHVALFPSNGRPATFEFAAKKGERFTGEVQRTADENRRRVLLRFLPGRREGRQDSDWNSGKPIRYR